MKFNTTTYIIALITLALYSIYIIGAMGLVGLLLSLSFGLIAASFYDAFEIVTVLVVMSGMSYVIVSRWLAAPRVCKKEGFSDGTPSEITGLIEKMEKGKYEKGRTAKPMPWTGVLSSGAVEGFADVSSAEENKEGAPKESGPAPTADTLKQKPADEEQKKVEQTVAPKKEEKVDGFTGNPAENAALFKVGQMPSDAADGPHVDAGTTLMKAMSALQPDQITSMTEDTKKLLETQKNLMGMLTNMRPVLQDGRKLLDTFSGIFGKDMGAGKGLGDMMGGFKLGA